MAWRRGSAGQTLDPVEVRGDRLDLPTHSRSRERGRRDSRPSPPSSRWASDVAQAFRHPDSSRCSAELWSRREFVAVRYPLRCCHQRNDLALCGRSLRTADARAAVMRVN